MRRFFLAFGLALVATPAFAQSGFSAEVAQPKAAYHDAMIEDVAWRCDGSHCQSTSDLNGASDSASCEELASQVGVLASFTGYKGLFSPDKLAKCNKGAPSK